MSDAIELSLGGNNKGFVAVLNDTEKKAKDTGSKVNKEFDKVGERGLKNRRKIMADLDGVAGEFGRVTTLSGGLDMALSRLGTGLKMAGAVTAVAAIGKGIYDATVSAREFELATSRIKHMNAGNVLGRSTSDLQTNAEQARGQRDENSKSMQSWAGRATAHVSDYAANLGNVIMGGESKSADELANLRENRAPELQENFAKAQDRIAEKNKQIFSIETERLKGNKSMADLMALQMTYAEKIQAAADTNNGAEKKRLEEEQKVVAAALKLSQDMALAQRVTREAIAGARAGDAQSAVGMSTEDAQRQANNQRVIEAGLASEDAKAASKAMPGDQDLASQAKIAEKEVNQIAAENAKWERDIARSKKDQLDSIEAELSSTRLTMQGRTIEAGLAVKIAANKLAAMRAEREGNTVLAERIRQQGQLLLTQEKYNRAIDASTGKLRPAGERMRDVREQRLVQRNRGRSNKRLDETGGLLRPERDGSGRIVSGIDPDTGKRVAPKPGTGGPTNTIGSSAGGGTNFEDELKQRGSAGSGTSFADELRQRKGTAGAEMNGRQAGAQLKADTLSNTNQAAKRSGQEAGGIEAKLNEIIRSLQEMNK